MSMAVFVPKHSLGTTPPAQPSGLLTFVISLHTWTMLTPSTRLSWQLQPVHSGDSPGWANFCPPRLHVCCTPFPLSVTSPLHVPPVAPENSASPGRRFEAHAATASFSASRA